MQETREHHDTGTAHRIEKPNLALSFFEPIPENILSQYDAHDRKTIIKKYNDFMTRHVARILFNYQRFHLTEVEQDAIREGRLPPINEENFQEAKENIAAMKDLAISDALAFFRIEKTGATDGLTGLLNKEAFAERYERERESVNSAEGKKEELSIIFIDIDYFKQFNTAYGHVKVDELLKAIGEKLKRVLRPGDVACRFGGDEIVLLLPHVATGQSQKVAERIYQELSNLAFAELKDGSGSTATEIVDTASPALDTTKYTVRDRVSMSVGVRTLTSDDKEIGYLKDVTALADAGVFKSKHYKRGAITMIEGQDKHGEFLSTTYKHAPETGAFIQVGEKGEKLKVEEYPSSVQDTGKKIMESLERGTLDRVKAAGHSNLTPEIMEAIDKLAVAVHAACNTK